MKTEEYEALAGVTLNRNLLPVDQAINAGLGLAGEAGEITDHLKKWIYHKHDLDREYIKDEVGDLLWYVQQLCDAMGITIEQCMLANVAKLRERYPDGFSAEASRNRKA